MHSSSNEAATRQLTLRSTGCLAAVAEELLFRGFLLTALRQRLGKVDSVAVSGALFALMHLSVEQFFQYSLLGFACGAASVSADSIVPAMVLHASYNLAAVLLAAASGGV